MTDTEITLLANADERERTRNNALPKSKNINTNVAKIETKLLTNDNNKEIVPNIPKANKIQKYDSRYSNHPSDNIRKSKIGKTDIKEYSRTANKKSNTIAYTRRTVPDNEISISGVNPQDRQTLKIKIIGEARTLEPTDDPT